MRYGIERPVTCTGIGLHSGTEVSLTFRPAAAGQGLTFIRTDLTENNTVTVTPDDFSGVNNMTCIMKNDTPLFKTVEHVCSAIHGLSIDDLIVETNSSEVPGIDGSAKGFVDLLQQAGIVTHDAPGRAELQIQHPVLEKGKEDTFLLAIPADTFKVSVIVEYAAYPFIGLQTFSQTITRARFVRDIAPARTLGKVKDLKEMWSKGLGLGVTLDNAIGIDEKGYSCALRYPDEIVRHKVMDLIGDLCGLQKDIKAHIIGFKPNHRLNIAFMKKLSSLR